MAKVTWQKALIDAGGPIIKGLLERAVGGGLKGKIAGGLADSVLKSLGEAFGTDPTPEAIGAAIERDPVGAPVIVQAVEAEVTMAMEASSGDLTAYLSLLSQDAQQEGLLARLWRPTFAYVFTICFAIQVVTICWLMWTRQWGTLKELSDVVTFLTFLDVAGCAVLGVQIWQRSEEKKKGVA